MGAGHFQVGAQVVGLVIEFDVAVLDELEDAIEHVDETLRAGIDHPGLHQYRQLVRGIGQGLLGVGQGRLEPLPEMEAPRVDLKRFREHRNDAQDGAFLRIRQRLPRSCCTMLDGLAHLLHADHMRWPDALRDAGEELRQDGAGIAARAVDGMFADPAQQLAGAMRLAAQRAGQDIAEGKRQIATGVAVRNRKYIDFIQVVALRKSGPARPRNQRSAQHRCAYHGNMGFQAQCIHQWLFLIKVARQAQAVNHF